MSPRLTPTSNKFCFILPRLPNVDLPLTVLADMGGANKASARVFKARGLIRVYIKHDNLWVSTEEMKRLLKTGLIEIEE